MNKREADSGRRVPAAPSPNGGNGGHGPDGRFLPGNPGGPGNPRAAAVGVWREALAEAVSAEDLGEVLGVLVAKAKAGEPWAVRELLDRCLGRPKQEIAVPEAVGFDVLLARLYQEADPLDDPDDAGADPAEAPDA